MGNREGKAAGLRSLSALLRGMFASRRGVAAVEFAFIAPVLLCLYFVTMEVAQGIETNKKVGRIGSMVADLITQQQTITASELDAIMQIGEATLQPYNRSQPIIVVYGIEITDEDGTPKATTVWGRRLVNGEGEPWGRTGDDVTASVPSELRIPGTFLVNVVANLAYTPMIAWRSDQKKTLGLLSAFDELDMQEHYYLRPRMSNSIPCPDC